MYKKQINKINQRNSKRMRIQQVATGVAENLPIIIGLKMMVFR